jgi:exopolysaccharide production protein ExoZ
MRDNIASIQFLRFVAAVLVVLVHTAHAVNRYLSGSISSAFAYIADFGGVGVHIFFVISGFIMVYTSFHFKNDPFSAKAFFVRRIIRIYPIYFIYAFAYLLFYHFFAAGKNLSIGQLFGSFFLLPGYSYYIIGPGWTLAYEVYFYLCFGIAMGLGLWRGLSALTLFFLAAILLGALFLPQHPVIHVLTNSLLIEFLLGAWIGYAAVTSWRVDCWLANVALALGISGFLAGIIFGLARLPFALTWGIPSALLVAGVVFREKSGRVPSLIKKLSFLGDSSYSLYLLHILLIDAIIFLAFYLDNALGVHVRLLGTFVMFTVCLSIVVFCVAASFICYEQIERKLISYLQRLYRGQQFAISLPSSKT